MKTCQQKAQRGAARKQRQRGDFGGAQRPGFSIMFDQGARLRDVELPIGFEAPRVEADRKVIGEGIVACKIKIDEAGQRVADEKDVVGKKVGMDHA